jgi:adenosylcobinamide-GDP ribazoletransferase
LLSLLLFAIPWAAGTSALKLALTIGTVLAGSLAVTALSWRQIRGQTGDVAGAAQQVGEVLGLAVLGLHL